jgi:hypothetical protein
MRNRIKELIQEALGVPSGIVDSAKKIFTNLSSQVNNVDIDSRDSEYFFEIEEDITISDVTFDGVNFTITCHEDDDYGYIVIAGYHVATRGKKSDVSPIIHYEIPTTLNIEMVILAPSDFTFNDIIELFKTQKTEIIKSLTHELKHSFDQVKKPFEKTSNSAEYSVYSNLRLGLEPINRLLHYMYFVTLTESLVRPSELASIIDIENISQRDFLKFLTSNSTYQKLKEINSFSIEELKEELMGYIPEITQILEQLNEPTNISDKEKIDLFLNVFLMTLKNAKARELDDMLVSNFMEMATGVFHPNKEKYFKQFIKKLEKFKNAQQFLEYQEKYFKFVTTKVMKKLSKLYAMAKKDNTNESIENWEAYHKINKPKYTEFVKESKYFKTKK